jgi:predicted transcriptional regulator of viral defense system
MHTNDIIVYKKVQVVRMKNTKRIIDMMKNNNGIVTTAQVTNAGISRSSLKLLLNRGLIEKAERGVYILPEAWEDEIFNMQQKYRKGIFSLDTSLFLHGLTDRTPNRYHMTFPLNYNISNVDKEHIISNRVKLDLYGLGKVKVKTPSGNEVYCYNSERTLCDILKTRSKTDIQLISEAFKNYVKSGNKDIGLLSEYSRIIGVEERLRNYLEVLL